MKRRRKKREKYWKLCYSIKKLMKHFLIGIPVYIFFFFALNNKAGTHSFTVRLLFIITLASSHRYINTNAIVSIYHSAWELNINCEQWMKCGLSLWKFERISTLIIRNKRNGKINSESEDQSEFVSLLGSWNVSWWLVQSESEKRI